MAQNETTTTNESKNTKKKKNKIALKATLVGHKDRAWCVAFEPNRNDILATCSSDKTVKIWKRNVKRDDDDIRLNPEYTTQYKSIVARANYLSIDRPDIQFAVKKLATSMSSPTNRN